MSNYDKVRTMYIPEYEFASEKRQPGEEDIKELEIAASTSQAQPICLKTIVEPLW